MNKFHMNNIKVEVLVTEWEKYRNDGPDWDINSDPLKLYLLRYLASVFEQV